MDVLDYLRIIRRRWRLAAAVVALAAVAALITMPSTKSADSGRLQSDQPKTSYTATTTLLRTATSPGDLPLSTLPVFVKTGAVPKAAAKEIGWTEDPNLLGLQIDAVPADGTSTLALTASGSDGALAARTADAFAGALIQFLRERARTTAKAQIASLREQLDQNRQDFAAVTGSTLSAQAERDGLDSAYQAIQQAITNLQVQSATAGFGLQVLQPASPVPVVRKNGSAASVVASSGSSPLKHTLILIVFGLILGLGVALVVERFDTRLRGRERFEEHTRLPVVVGVPLLPRHRRAHREVVSVTSPHSAVAESFRSLRSALLLLPSRPVPELLFDERLTPEQGTPSPAPITSPRVVLVTSARAREGKTTTVVNLASALAESGRRVIVIDCDFRNPEAHRFLGVTPGRGLSDLLAANHGHPLDSVLQPTMVPNVRLVTAGSSTEHPGALLGTMGPYVRQAREAADIVLIDAPPALLANDAIDVMPFVDTVLVVARDGGTTVSEATRLSHLLGRLQVACLGVVLIGASDAGAAYFGQEDVLRRRRFWAPRDTTMTESESGSDGSTAHGGKRRAGDDSAR
jgi:capsular exopolysaccharide synthesis family protein